MIIGTMTRTGRLLIVDDDEGVTQTFAGILRLEGHQVRTAGNAQDGLREAEEFRPDAIILDLRMPLVNGLGFLYRLREELARTPDDDAALGAALRTSGRAIVFVAASIGAGFGVIGFTRFFGLRLFGTLMPAARAITFFAWSNVYLMLVFTAVAVDALLR